VFVTESTPRYERQEISASSLRVDANLSRCVYPGPYPTLHFTPPCTVPINRFVSSRVPRLVHIPASFVEGVAPRPLSSNSPFRGTTYQLPVTTLRDLLRSAPKMCNLSDLPKYPKTSIEP
jgi:hypothetical protein